MIASLKERTYLILNTKHEYYVILPINIRECVSAFGIGTDDGPFSVIFDMMTSESEWIIEDLAAEGAGHTLGFHVDVHKVTFGAKSCRKFFVAHKTLASLLPKMLNELIDRINIDTRHLEFRILDKLGPSNLSPIPR